ncbi:hypothetical protein OIN60_02735 [Paenibacillus sp. P96]|uniref:MSP domain-containing protein n=1 Tax=Paenibacillus zeirhizosphaerae TaxID=2987519 RepID=A0ABT9FLU0_9BACL|nr:hypothetical protein [Paenibacillus sp. P96]MDP4095707.1 hypothetical protein [Paenibacillus sp. P96]
MAILLPSQPFLLAAGVGSSYFEDLTGGTNASVTVNNTSANPVSLVLYTTTPPVLTYTIPPGNARTIEVGGLQVAALQAPAAGAVAGFIQVAVSDF